MTQLIARMGSLVLTFGVAAQLFSESMLCLTRTFVTLCVIIFVNTFLTDSSSVIGLIFERSFSQSFVLGMGYMDPLFHSLGILCFVNASLKIMASNSVALGPSLFSARYGICEDPGAEMLLVCLIVSCISASVISSVVPSYHSCSTSFKGLYSSCHSGGIFLSGCVCIQFWKCRLSCSVTSVGSVITVGSSPCVTILSIFIDFLFLSIKLFIILFLSVSSQ